MKVVALCPELTPTIVARSTPSLLPFRANEACTAQIVYPFTRRVLSDSVIASVLDTLRLAP